MTHYNVVESYFDKIITTYPAYSVDLFVINSIEAQIVIQINCPEFNTNTDISILAAYKTQCIYLEDFVIATSIDTVEFIYTIINSSLSSVCEFSADPPPAVPGCGFFMASAFESTVKYTEIISDLNFNSVNSLESNIRCLIIANDFENISSLNARVQLLIRINDFENESLIESSLYIILQSLDFSVINSIDIHQALVGFFIQSTDLITNCSIKSDTWFSLNIPNLNTNTNYEGFPCILINDVLDFVSFNEIVSEAFQIWRLFTHTSGGQLAQGTHQINSTPLTLYDYSNYFVNELSTDIVFSSIFHNSLRDSDLCFAQYNFNSLGLINDQVISTSISNDITFFNAFHNSLRDSDLCFAQYNFNSLGLINDQVISTSISNDITFFNAFHNSLRDSDLCFAQYNFNSLGLINDQVISTPLSDSIFKEHFINVPLASDSFISEQYVFNNLSEYNFVTTQFINLDVEYFGRAGSNGLASLWYDPPPGPQSGGIPVITYIYFDIFIDGISIKERIKDINLTQRESDVISHIEIEFKDTLSFNMCSVDQGTGIGTERIELRIGGDLSDSNKYTIYKFLLEERSANESNHSFTVWGRQITALLTEPFSESITQTFENRTSSSIAQELAGSISVNWTAYDNLNLEYNLDGTPLAGIQRLAEVVNAIVRTDPDGSLVIRPRFPVRPMNLIDGNCTINTTLDRYMNIVSADYSEEQSQYNTVEVQGGSISDNIDISIVPYEEYNINIAEEIADAEQKSDFQIDDIAYLRIYHNNNIVYDPTNQFDDTSTIGYSLCTTFSSTNVIQFDNDELIEDEVIDIINGTGNLSKNPTTINSWQWEGTPKFGDCQEDNVIVSFDESNITAKDSNNNNVLIGKMKVTYTTRYDLFEITCNEEKEIIVAALISEHPGVYLKITMDSVSDPSGEKPAPKIEDDLITDETTALMRGQSILDDTYYKKCKYTIQIPFYLDLGLFDGDVVRMEDDFWNIIGNAIIRSADISINIEDSGVVKIWQNIELHQYVRP